MARAKRTDRAEARRKYRAYLLEQEETAAEADDADATTAAWKAKPARDPKAPSIQPGQRMPLFAAARAAYRTPHYIDDIRNIRTLIFGSKAVWPVLAVCVLAGTYSGIQLANGAQSTDSVLTAINQFVFFPIPLLPPMMAGFLTPRSSWLAGAIASLIATMTTVWMYFILLTAGGMSEVPIAGYGTVVTQATLASYATQVLSGSIAFGILMGAGTAWYKRFLKLTSGGGSGKRTPTKSSARSAQGRRPATRG